MRKFKPFVSIFICLVFILVLVPLAGCKDQEKMINVYDIQTKTIIQTDIESYVEAVVAGEISNEAPMESLKAQAVLARTFTINFLENNKSKYEGADISTDISEAQAYNKEKVNDRIKQAVRETKGEYIEHNGQPIVAYFHSNSGGKTTLPKEGFNSQANYDYIKSVESVETKENSKNYSWTYKFTKTQILDALRNMGQSIASLSSFKKGEVGESGRCLTFIIGGKEVSATTFRQQIGSTKLKSTLIDTISIDDYGVTFTGRGYGHGVGLSQEGAIVLAEQGKNYKDIISFYFKDINIIKD